MLFVILFAAFYRALQATILAGFVIAAAFILFCLALVAALTGVIDPHSNPHAELSKLARGVEAVYSKIHHILNMEVC